MLNTVAFLNPRICLPINSPAVPKPPSVAPSVAPSEDDVGWLKPREAEPGPGWPEPCEKREELCEDELREEEP